MKALGLTQKLNDGVKASQTLVPGDKATLDADDERQNAEAGRAEGHEVFIARYAL